MRGMVNLTSDDLDRLVRLIRVFTDDPDYEVRPEHVKEQWMELFAEDRGEGRDHFDEDHGIAVSHDRH